MVTRRKRGESTKERLGGVFGRTSVDKAAERLKGIRSGNTQFWTPKEGANTIRILPPWRPDGDEFWEEAGSHWSVGPGNKMFYCPNKTNGASCYLCEVVEDLLTSEYEEDLDKASRMKARTSILYNIVDLKEPEVGVQVYRSGVKVFEQLLQYASDSEWGDFTDPDEGFDVVIRRTGEGISTQYSVALKRSPSPIQDPNWLDQLKDLHSLVQFATEAEMKAALEGVEKDTEDEEVDEDEEIGEKLSEPAPVVSRSAQRRLAAQKAPVEEPEEEEKPECFGVEYFQLVDCDDCEFEDDCRILYKVQGKRSSPPRRGASKRRA